MLKNFIESFRSSEEPEIVETPIFAEGAEVWGTELGLLPEGVEWQAVDQEDDVVLWRAVRAEPLAEVVSIEHQTQKSRARSAHGKVALEQAVDLRAAK